MGQRVSVVELELGGEPESVPQRPWQQPRSGRRADEGERRDLQGNRRGAGALPDHHVDPKIFHGQIEHLLGRAAHAMDLVEKEDLALAQARQNRSQVTGVLDRRPARHAQRRAELVGHDHRERGLAQSGRARQEHVIGHRAAVFRALQHETELVRHPRLALELAQRRRPQRGLDRTFVGCRVGIDRRRLVGLVHDRHATWPATEGPLA